MNLAGVIFLRSILLLPSNLAAQPDWAQVEEETLSHFHCAVSLGHRRESGESEHSQVGADCSQDGLDLRCP